MPRPGKGSQWRLGTLGVAAAHEKGSPANFATWPYAHSGWLNLTLFPQEEKGRKGPPKQATQPDNLKYTTKKKQKAHGRKKVSHRFEFL